MVYEGINNGDRTTLQLPSAEQELLVAIKAACDSALKPLTVVLTSGGGLAIDTTQAAGLSRLGIAALRAVLRSQRS